MPIYEYQCQACRSLHEVLQKVSDPLLKKCPECGKSKLKKIVSAPSFRLSGTGWYETDFKSDKDKKRNLASNDSQKDSSAKDSKNKNDKKGKGEKAASDKTSAKASKKSEKPKSTA